MKHIFNILILLLLPCLAMSQKFSLLKASEHWSMGTVAGIANHRGSVAKSPNHINFNMDMDFGVTTFNVFTIRREFNGWKYKTRRQRLKSILNSAAYLGIGLGARQLTILSANKFSNR